MEGLSDLLATDFSSRVALAEATVETSPNTSISRVRSALRLREGICEAEAPSGRWGILSREPKDGEATLLLGRVSDGDDVGARSGDEMLKLTGSVRLSPIEPMLDELAPAGGSLASGKLMMASALRLLGLDVRTAS
jgi:hypothetical protein